MRMKTLMPIAVAVFSMLFGSAAVSHHGFYGEYALDDRIDFTGTVVGIEWTNPHAFVLVETVVDAAQTVVRIELQSPSQLSRRGWKGDELNFGETVRVTNAALQLRGDSMLACCARIRDLHGKEFYTDPRPDTPLEDNFGTSIVEGAKRE